MSGNDDYLHNPQAAPDPEIAALEDALRPLRIANEVPSERVLAAAAPRPWWPWLLVATAATAAAAALLLWLDCAGGVCNGLQPGCCERSFICQDEELQVQLGDLAVITLQPESELQFVHWRENEQALFRLKKGGMRAVVVPPPRVKAGFFVVESPRGTVVDQGCTYELVINKDGVTRVYVEAGAVTFTNEQRTVWVPAGAIAMVGPEGVRTPTFLTASPKVQELVERMDELVHSKNRQGCDDVVIRLAQECSQPGDTLPLWHVLQGGDLGRAKTATEALFRLVGSPDGKGDRRMLSAEQWLDYLREVAWQ